MFSRAAKSVVKNFGQTNCHAGECNLKNTRTLVLATENSRVPGILTSLVEQTAKEPVSNVGRNLEQNGLVAFATKKNSLEEKAKHNTGNEDMTLKSEAVSTESQKTKNPCKSNLSQGLELPKSGDKEFLDVLWKLPKNTDPSIIANRQLKEFQVSAYSQNLGISKQKTETWSSISESAQILGEIGPGSSRSCYSKTNFEKWLPELIEYCRIPDYYDTGLHGCSYYPPPSVRRKKKSKKLKIKSRRKKALNGRGRKSTSGKKGTAVIQLDRQLCSTMVRSHHRPGLNKGVGKRKRRVNRVGDGRIRWNKRNFLKEGHKLKAPKIQINSPTVKRTSCSRKSLKRFFQKSNTARQNWIVPPILSNRKPNFLHNFDGGKKTLKPKLTARIQNPIPTKVSKSLKRTTSTVEKIVAKVPDKARTLKTTHSNCNVIKKHKPRRIRHCPIRPSVKPGRKRSAISKPSQLVDNTDDEVSALDVESLSITCAHDTRSLRTSSLAIEESLVNNCSSRLPTAVCRNITTDEESCRPKSKDSLTETSCCASFEEQKLSSIDCNEEKESRENQISGSDEVIGSQAYCRGCAVHYGESQVETPSVVQSCDISISRQKIKHLIPIGKSVSIASGSLPTMASYSLNEIYGSFHAIEYASGEPKDFDEKFKYGKSKKLRSGFGKLSERLSRCGISKKKKKKSSGIKGVKSYQKRDSDCLKL